MHQEGRRRREQVGGATEGGEDALGGEDEPGGEEVPGAGRRGH